MVKCTNCNKTGHHHYQCKLPMTSCGIILCRKQPGGGFQGLCDYLVICRKHTFGFIDFVRGKYNPLDVSHLQTMFDEMTLSEKQYVLTKPFEWLWSYLWSNASFLSQPHMKTEEAVSCKKMEQLRQGIMLDESNKVVTLDELVSWSTTSWTHPEWEFPKGRRNAHEKDADCALREFEEETGILKERVTLVENALPFETVFVGSNSKSYRYKYYLAVLKNPHDDLDLTNFQQCEISNVSWKSVQECMQVMRPYDYEKRQLIRDVDLSLKAHSLVCL